MSVSNKRKFQGLAVFLISLALLSLFATGPTEAQRRSASAAIERANQGTVGVITGGFGSTDLRIVADLATVLNEKPQLRILPIIGEGSVQNISDILYLRGIDVGIVQSDVFSHLKKTGRYNNIEDRVNYIAKLFNVEFHLLAGKGIETIGDLAGRKVSFGVAGSGTHVTAEAVFGGLGIAVDPIDLDINLAIQQLKAGKIAAIAYVSGKPDSVISGLGPKDGLHLVPVDYAKPLRRDYYPAFFTYGDYPGLISKGDRVPSVSVGTILAVYNWTVIRGGGNGYRGRKVKTFIDAFFAHHKELAEPPRHPKWREMNIAAEVPGWKRYPPAQKKLDEELKRQKDGT